nr:response regulator [Thalassococcus arenae]
MIVQSRDALASLWKRHLDRFGAHVAIASTQEQAIDCMMAEEFQVMVLDLVLDEGSALAVADYASFRQPEARVIFVTNTSFFSDGSIFRHFANACAYLPATTPPSDLAAMVEHYAQVH